MLTRLEKEQKNPKIYMIGNEGYIKTYDEGDWNDGESLDCQYDSDDAIWWGKHRKTEKNSILGGYKGTFLKEGSPGEGGVNCTSMYDAGAYQYKLDPNDPYWEPILNEYNKNRNNK